MSELNEKRQDGDSGGYAEALRGPFDAANQFRMAAAQRGASAGAEAVANAAAATVQAGLGGGKAVAGVAAGTALGGPLGTVISAAWSSRHTIGKAVISACVALMIITQLVVALPSIIFNSNGATGAIDASANGLTAAYSEMSAIVSGCVDAGYRNALSEVERIISENGCDYELSMNAITDNAHSSAGYDVGYILAAYSLSLNQEAFDRQDLKDKLDAAAPLMFPVTHKIQEAQETQDADGESHSEVIKYAACTIHPFDTSAILSVFGINPEAPYGSLNVSAGDAIQDMALALKKTLNSFSLGSAQQANDSSDGSPDGSHNTNARANAPMISSGELKAFMDRLVCSPERKSLIQAGLSLVGRVPYFWGGKSAGGWNGTWNTPKLVTAAGDSTTGTLQPFGLDCSGFTDWVYKTALGEGLPAGSSGQWGGSFKIAEADLLPGDLGFKNAPSPNIVNHVLIYAGTDENGRKMWVHCQGGTGVTFSSPAYIKYYRRVNGMT